MVILAFTSTLSALDFDASLVISYDPQLGVTKPSSFQLNDKGEIVYVRKKFYYFNREEGGKVITEIPEHYWAYDIKGINNSGAFVGEESFKREDQSGSWRVYHTFVYYPDLGVINLSELASDMGEIDTSARIAINDQGLVAGTIMAKDKDQIFTYSPEDGFKIIKGTSIDQKVVSLNNNGQILVRYEPKNFKPAHYIYDYKTKSRTELNDFGIIKTLKNELKEYYFKGLNVFDHIKVLRMNDNGMIIGYVVVGDKETEYDGFLHRSEVYFVYSKDFGLKIIPVSYRDYNSYQVAINNSNQIVITGHRLNENNLEYTGEFGTYIWDPMNGLQQLVNWENYFEDKWNDYVNYNNFVDFEQYLDWRFYLGSAAINEQGEVFLVARVEGIMHEDNPIIYWDTNNGGSLLFDLIKFDEKLKKVRPHHYSLMRRYRPSEFQINSRGEILIRRVRRLDSLDDLTILLTPSS